MPKTDYRLLRARRRVSKTTYQLFNRKTGCHGTVVQNTSNGRSTVTVYHGTNCRCLDIRMSALAEHAQRRYKRRHIKATRRDDLLIAIKLRLPKMGIRYKMPVSIKPTSTGAADSKEDDNDDQPVRVLDEMGNGQVLVEEWKSAEAWRRRTIWKDW
ncbi:hypothetical protein GGS23DRAFT_425327 [Durotheca rogersii]|uniref:uncharacterized protein n=1 Tax=Durotheca rogersii TaxID=419775 RepID=UPI00221F82F1|nr:uncharacterized protein GGS23DRAFT_425327 [Durotheca rogersii]KAI5865396.1 hypothetical protein GGS23DRAFT_425327 [Durotheca rogersii]